MHEHCAGEHEAIDFIVWQGTQESSGAFDGHLLVFWIGFTGQIVIRRKMNHRRDLAVGSLMHLAPRRAHAFVRAEIDRDERHSGGWRLGLGEIQADQPKPLPQRLGECGAEESGGAGDHNGFRRFGHVAGLQASRQSAHACASFPLDRRPLHVDP
jgi:hypothetical protein